MKLIHFIRIWEKNKYLPIPWSSPLDTKYQIHQRWSIWKLLLSIFYNFLHLRMLFLILIHSKFEMGQQLEHLSHFLFLTIFTFFNSVPNFDTLQIKHGQTQMWSIRESEPFLLLFPFVLLILKCESLLKMVYEK